MEKTQKNNNLKEGNYLDSSDNKILMELIKTHICKIKIGDRQGTGFFCLIKDESTTIKVLMTATHIFGEDIQPGKTINYSINNEEKECRIVIDKTRTIFNDEEFDVSIIEIKNEDEIDEKSFFNLDNQIFQDDSAEIFVDKQIYLLYYPFGGDSLISSGQIKKLEQDEIFYLCQTEKGCGGCPIINKTNFHVIGIHKGMEKNKKYKIGSLLKKPTEQFILRFKKFQENEELKEEKNVYINHLIILFLK